MKHGIILLVLFYYLFSFAGSSTRSIDADQIKSSDHTKTWPMPAASGTLITGVTATAPILSSGTNVSLGTVGRANGGTGLTSGVGAGLFIYDNGTAYTGGTIAAGSGIAVTNNGTGTYTISATNSGSVTSLFQGSGISLNPSPITGVGTISANIGASSPLSSTGSSLSLNFLSPLSTTGGSLSLNILSPLTTTGGSLSIPVSTNSVDGYLSAADHTTFSNKQNTIAVSSPILLTAGTLISHGTSGVSAGTYTNATVTVDQYGHVTSASSGTGGSGSVSSIIGTNGVTTNPSAGITTVGTLSVNASNINTGTLGISAGGTGKSTQTAAFDNLSPNTSKGDVTVHNGTNNVRQPVGAFGQTIRANSNTTNGLEYVTGLYKNYVINPSCGTLGTANITVTTGTISANTSSPLDSQSDCAISATATGGKYCWQVNTFDNALTAIPQNCEAKFNYTGTATAFKSYVSINGTVQTASLRGTLDSSGIYDLNFPCATGTALLCVEATAATSAINVANLYVGPQTNIGSVSAVGPTISSGTIQVSAVTTPPTKGTTTVDSVSYYQDGEYAFITYSLNQGSGISGSGDYLYALPAGLSINTNIAPLDTGSILAASSNSRSVPAWGEGWNSGQTYTITGAVPYDSTHFRIITVSEFSAKNFQGSGLFNFSVALGLSFTVKIPISGWTSTSQAVRSDQTDIPWTDYTPDSGVSQGLGTFTTNKCQWQRISADMYIRCNITTGTVSGVEARLALPTGYTSVSTLPTLQGIGRVFRGANANDQTFVAIEASKGYLVFTVQNAGANAMTKQIGTNVFASTETVSFFTGPIPISGWASTGRAPVLIGSITQKTGNAKLLSVSDLANNGTCTVSSDPEGMVASGSHTATGGCTWTLTTGYFISTPRCWCNATLNPGVQKFQCDVQEVSATSIKTFTATGVGTDTDTNLTFYCYGARN